ncbi:STAS domain-containing protein [Mycolicibacterium madagascariense]|nr:STAS domain-containing protein [Mycolicibacterium madagascariense]
MQPSTKAGIRILTVRGALDLSTAPVLSAAIADSLHDPYTAIVVDLSELEFLASAGMTVLLEGHGAAGDVGKELGVVADGPGTSRPITMMGVDQVVPLYASLDAALTDLR